MTRREREVTDISAIRSILDRSKVLHLGLVDDGEPYIVPMNYGYTMDEENRLTLYLHCARTGYKLDVIRKNPKCCFELECGLQPFEGKVACQYGMIYESLMGKGEVTIVEDVDEKIKAMVLLMKSQTGKDFEFNEPLVSIVTILRIDVSVYTAKKRPLPAAMQEGCEG